MHCISDLIGHTSWALFGLFFFCYLMAKNITIMSVSLFEQLCNAVHSSDAQNVKYLLEVENVDPNPQEDEHESPLLTACRNNNLDIAKLLITNKKHPADPNGYYPSHNHETPFTVALELEYMELINLLLDESIVKVQVNCTRIRICLHKLLGIYSTVTALTLAIRKQNLPLVKTLLDAGADSNLTTEDAHDSPLTCAITCGNVDICRELFRRGCDPYAISVTNICKVMKSEVSAQATTILVEQGDFAIRHQDILLDLFIKHRRNKKLEHCLQHIYNQVGEDVQGWKKDFVQTALSSWSTNCLRVLLRWGFYTCHYTLHPREIIDDSTFYISTRTVTLYTILRLLVEFNPMCLQESWFMNGKITQRCLESSNEYIVVTIAKLIGSTDESPNTSSFL